MRSYPTIGGKGRVVLSFDDYHPENIRIDDILHKEGLEATFFIETGTMEARAQIKELFNRGHEIGGHTIHHPADIKLLHQIEAVGEIEGCKKMIEAITGRPCESFAYPRGRHNDDIRKIVERAGFKDARTTHVLHTEEPEDPYQTHTTVHLYEGRAEYKGRGLLQMVDFHLNHVVKHGGVMHIWGHAFEFERDDLWKTLWEIVQKVGDNVEI